MLTDSQRPGFTKLWLAQGRQRNVAQTLTTLSVHEQAGAPRLASKLRFRSLGINDKNNEFIHNPANMLEQSS